MKAMEKIMYPERSLWPMLIRRPEIAFPDLKRIVNQIFDEVNVNGDDALFLEQFRKAWANSLNILNGS